MIPKFRAWSKLASRMYIVNGLYFDRGMVQYANNDNAIRFIKLENIILMQSTCLFDKNNKEIFEGDIVLVLDSPYTVFYDIKEGSYRLKPHDTRWVVDYMCNFSSEESFEIVGNIYENKEYL